VLGGVSRETLHSIKELIGVMADKILLDMQNAVIASTLNIALKILHGVSKFLLRRTLWTGQTFIHTIYFFLGFLYHLSNSLFY